MPAAIGSRALLAGAPVQSLVASLVRRRSSSPIVHKRPRLNSVSGSTASRRRRDRAISWSRMPRLGLARSVWRSSSCCPGSPAIPTSSRSQQTGRPAPRFRPPGVERARSEGPGRPHIALRATLYHAERWWVLHRALLMPRPRRDGLAVERVASKTTLSRRGLPRRHLLPSPQPCQRHEP